MAVPVLAPPRHLPPPGATLPRGRERLRTGTAVSMALHALVLLVVLWQTTDIFGGGGHGSGPRGGGGGGGRPAVTWFTLPPPSGPTVAVDVPALPAVAVSDLPVPDPVQLNLPQLTVPHDISPTTPVGKGPGQSGGTGNGPGNGGGTGTGTGPGTGSDVGRFVSGVTVVTTGSGDDGGRRRLHSARRFAGVNIAPPVYARTLHGPLLGGGRRPRFQGGGDTDAEGWRMSARDAGADDGLSVPAGAESQWTAGPGHQGYHG